MVSVKGLHFSYPKKTVFKGLDLEIKPGYIYGLLGKNGTGKTTLLYNLAGLLFPVKGSVKVGGFIPGERKPAFLQDIFMVPEEFSLPDVSIKQYVKYTSPF